MKFCYVDESGVGNEPYSVMVGIIVDVQRMQVTKSHWKGLLNTLSDITKREIKEFHTKDFYNGYGVWREIDGVRRAQIINAILNWLKERRHKITFTAVNRSLFDSEINYDQRFADIGTLWRFMGLHIVLTLQKYHQKELKNKGNTVFIFDNKEQEHARFSKLIANPPNWSDSYYCKKGNQLALDQVIDVPYYADSEEVYLIQIADLISYIIRRYLEISENKIGPKYKDEPYRVTHWIKEICKISLPISTRYPKKREQCSELFYKYCPNSLRCLGE